MCLLGVGGGGGGAHADATIGPGFLFLFFFVWVRWQGRFENEAAKRRDLMTAAAAMRKEVEALRQELVMKEVELENALGRLFHKNCVYFVSLCGGRRW